MKKRLYIAIAALLMCGMTQMAEAKTRNAHAEAHKQQLAAAKNIGLDKTTITRMVEEDIAARESSKAISAETDELLNDILTEARSHIGKKYVWATKGPNTFDCSGFSSYVYRQFGYSLSPSSKMQYTQGEQVEKGNLRKGDLVFFQGRSGTGGVGHVGIVVDVDEEGNFSFIHASVRKGVTITKGSEAYYAKRFLGGKRVIE